RLRSGLLDGKGGPVVVGRGGERNHDANAKKRSTHRKEAGPSSGPKARHTLERFGRTLSPLQGDGSTAGRHKQVCILPQGKSGIQVRCENDLKWANFVR